MHLKLALVNFCIFKSPWEVVYDKRLIFVHVHANFEQFHRNKKLCTLKISKSRLPYIYFFAMFFWICCCRGPIIILSQKTDFFLFVPVKFTARRLFWFLIIPDWHQRDQDWHDLEVTGVNKFQAKFQLIIFFKYFQEYRID